MVELHLSQEQAELIMKELKCTGFVVMMVRDEEGGKAIGLRFEGYISEKTVTSDHVKRFVQSWNESTEKWDSQPFDDSVSSDWDKKA